MLNELKDILFHKNRNIFGRTTDAVDSTTDCNVQVGIHQRTYLSETTDAFFIQEASAHQRVVCDIFKHSKIRVTHSRL